VHGSPFADIFAPNSFCNEIRLNFYNKKQDGFERFALNHNTIQWHQESEAKIFNQQRESRERLFAKSKGFGINKVRSRWIQKVQVAGSFILRPTREPKIRLSKSTCFSPLIKMRMWVMPPRSLRLWLAESSLPKQRRRPQRRLLLRLRHNGCFCQKAQRQVDRHRSGQILHPHQPQAFDRCGAPTQGQRQIYRAFPRLNLGRHECSYYIGVNGNPRKEQQQEPLRQKEADFLALIPKAYQAKPGSVCRPFQGKRADRSWQLGR
jgi:hypothetical protein